MINHSSDLIKSSNFAEGDELGDDTTRSYCSYKKIELSES